MSDKASIHAQIATGMDAFFVRILAHIVDEMQSGLADTDGGICVAQCDLRGGEVTKERRQWQARLALLSDDGYSAEPSNIDNHQ